MENIITSPLRNFQIFHSRARQHSLLRLATTPQFWIAPTFENTFLVHFHFHCKKKLLIKKHLDLDKSDLWLHLPSVYILWRYSKKKSHLFKWTFYSTCKLKILLSTIYNFECISIYWSYKRYTSSFMIITRNNPTSLNHFWVKRNLDSWFHQIFILNEQRNNILFNIIHF